MRNVVFFSSGIGSWAAAKIVAEQEGDDGLVLLFADTKIEDQDNYRFLRESAENVGGDLVVISDGRTPWEVFRDERWIGNSRVAQCSHLLKQKPCLEWMKERDPNHECVLHFGIDWTEVHRLPAIERNWSPWKVRAPLTDPPYHTKESLIEWCKSEGIEPPRLYGMGFSHANCGGFCVRGGQAHFRNLLRVMPERYLHHEAQEESMRQYLEKDQSILTEVKGGEKRTLTLRELRMRADSQVDLFDWGGCGCFVDEVK